MTIPMDLHLDIRHWEDIHIRELCHGVTAIIAIHTMNRGPALGGSRFYNYQDHALKTVLALEDVLRLSRGMSYKAAAANLPLGGGKSVLIGEPTSFNEEERAEIFLEFGDFVHSMNGTYITAEDVGTKVSDMRYVHQRTPHVVGLSDESGGLGDPSPVTAYGVAEAIRYLTKEHLQEAPDKLKVAVQGTGKVGYYLCKELHADGYQLVVTDVNAENLRRVKEEFGAEVENPDTFIEIESDIYAPCAMGKVVTNTTVDLLKTRVICGAANNQLANQEMGDALQKRNILYAPDYIVNLGGLTLVHEEILKHGVEEAMVDTKTNIHKGLKEVFELAKAENIPTNIAADKIMRHRIYGKMAPASE